MQSCCFYYDAYSRFRYWRDLSQASLHMHVVWDVSFCRTLISPIDCNMSCDLQFKAPILSGREPIATDEEKKIGFSRSEELSAIVNQVCISC